jgi:hypothetical protein
MQSRSWRSLVAESVAVIASILIAFGLDAWWDRQGAEGELRAELVNVSQELTANRGEFESRREQHRRAQESIETLLTILGTAPGAARVVVSDSVLMEAFVFVPTSDPSTGALDALISSGGLANLASADLKRDLAGLRDSYSDLREVEMMARSLAYDRILPLLANDSALEPLLLRLLPPGTAASISEGGDLVEVDVPLAVRSSVRNYLSLRSGWVRDAEIKIDRLLTQLDEASESLAAELGGSGS